MNRDEVARVLTLHNKAYDFLLWLDKRATHDTQLFSEANVAAMTKGATCATWLLANRDSFPSELLPEEDQLEAFAHMLASFFQTSFHIRYLEFGGKILEARLAHGAGVASRRIGRKGRPIHQRSVMANALRRLAKAEGIAITERTGRRLADRSTIRSDVLIWTYVYELARRMTRASRGPVIRGIWRAMDPDTRRNLTVDVVWEARSRLLAVLQNARD